MKRRLLLKSLPLLTLLPAGLRASASSVGIQALPHAPEYWRDQVSPKAWKILFEEATEPAGSSALNDEHREGTFVCAACYLPLFDSSAKYESGTGWPSFTQPIEGHLGTKRDFKLIWPRTEYHCARCGGHQGHVFNDGPPPRGERWCNNGLALQFIPRTEPLPALRG
ncbi:peptide-methionine (R)-S-oxide reductase MsrB [Pseudomonas sp. NW5]|uniref:peptide-methionine (R)-S-oxide reductase MsrB n=1 Tax=Pseudomonas sp. NW5 TaxID=2934934 RepID=UPI00202017AE|nr:peptide-methionine (R)-S-oxide reductase MsrB [Pseudomonas sp. NW5]MCL7463375.1 peptide-methionine (R)-S-oxide reductase MsrB [Pseudomonas sp. NW5]